MTLLSYFHRLLPLFFLSWLLLWQSITPATQKPLIGIGAGALAGGERGAQIGYSVALSGELYNRQLHQNEIRWLSDDENIKGFAKAYGLSLEDARARLTQQGLRNIDKGWSLKLGARTDKEALSYLRSNASGLFEAKSLSEYYDGSTDGAREISSYSQKEFGHLVDFYLINVYRSTSTNPEGALRSASEAWMKEKGALDALREDFTGTINDSIRSFIPDTVNSLLSIPEMIQGAGNFLDASLPTITQKRLDILYGSHSDGSLLQANLNAPDMISAMGMSAGAAGILKPALGDALRVLNSRPSVVLHSNPESKKMVLQVGDRTYTQLSKNSRSTRTRIFEDVPPRDRQAVIDKLTEGARDVTSSSHPQGVKVYDHPDGTRINVRTVSGSTEKLGEHVTVDIIIKGDKSNKLELKFINSSKTKRQTQ
jgi:hypothetical protein